MYMRVNQPELSVVIPTRHEAATIGPFLHRLSNALAELDYEIIVVDDSDRDKTVRALLASQRDLSNERLIILHRPKGSVFERTLGTAVVTGIRCARGTYVCVMDADGQHPPEVIPQLLATARTAAVDYVGATRYVHGGSAAGLDGVGRKVVSHGLALLTRLTFVATLIRNLTDPLSGFFLFRRSLVEQVTLSPIGWKISLEILVRGRPRRVAEVPYVFASRADGKSKASLRQGLLLSRHILALLLSLALNS
jgi:dolichol-phosphate mannosyltransferase